MKRRQFGSVRRLPSGRWQASYWHLGRRHIAEVTLLTKADANAYLAAMETQIRRGSWIDPWGAQIGFADWTEEWKATIVDLRPSTKARDLGYLQRYVLPRFGSLELGEIDHMMVRSWVAKLSASGLAPSTTTKAAQLLSKIMRSAVQAGLLPESPCDGVRLPRIERVEMRFLDPGEVMALADAMDPRYRAAVLLAAYGGLRAGELFGLRAKRVDPAPHGHHRRDGGRCRRPSLLRSAQNPGRPSKRATPPGGGRPAGRTPRTYDRRPDDLVFTAPEGGPVQLNVWRRRFWAPACDTPGWPPAAARPAAHRSGVVDCRRGEPERSCSAGGTLVGELHARPLRASLSRLRERPQRFARRGGGRS